MVVRTKKGTEKGDRKRGQKKGTKKGTGILNDQKTKTCLSPLSLRDLQGRPSAKSYPSEITSWQQQTDSNAPTTYGLGYDVASQLSSAVKTGSTGTILGQYYDNYDAARNRVSEKTGQASLSDQNDD